MTGARAVLKGLLLAAAIVGCVVAGVLQFRSPSFDHLRYGVAALSFGVAALALALALDGARTGARRVKLRWHPTSDVFLILTSPCGQATAIGNREDWTLDAYQCPFCHQPMEPDGLVLSDRAGSI